ncbi:MAG: threonylcarbamoyl-AMP synthase [Candidatus Thermoplasmatota archaeon]|nr:threonylcarbamoyl-AMP synthase [Candidatus Thermoplasmatota archaeon]
MTLNDVSVAMAALHQGDLVIYPTDTLYALGADVFNEHAVQNVFTLKHRPFSLPLPVAVASHQDIETVAILNPAAEKISKALLPGPLTLLLHKKPSIPPLVTSGQDTIAVRIPNHPVALQLLSDYGPLTVTSANLHSEKTPALISDILIQLHAPHLVSLNAGRLAGAPSTLVDLTTPTPRIIREGPITEHQLLEVLSHE